MTGRVIAIGDIHGCDVALEALITAINPSSDDTIVALGDYVDRGPHSKQVIDRLIELRGTCNLVTLYGNHEEMMRTVVLDDIEPYEWLRHGGVDTLDSYGFVGDLSVVPTSHRDFLRDLQTYYQTDTHLFFHANYDPAMEPADQPEDLLRWVKLTEYLPEPHFSGRRVIVGHTHNRKAEIVSYPHLVCIDTYCYGGGLLTALDTTNDVIWQCTRDGVMKSQEPVKLG
jgi:serine/threonine protein phosphatase 1